MINVYYDAAVEILTFTFYSEDISDDEWEKFIDENITPELINEVVLALIEGERRGYSLNTQKKLIKYLFYIDDTKN